MIEPLDQLLYFHTKEPLIGNVEGVHLAASSLPRTDFEYWNRLLFPLVGVDHPYETLCYLISKERGQAALMYRIPEVAHRIRPFIHVLIGRQNELTPKLALGSFAWNWYGAITKRPEGNMQVLRKIDGEELVSFEKEALAGWDAITGARAGARPPEVDQLIIKIRDHGGPDDGSLWDVGKDSLSSLGDRNFVILSSADRTLDDQALTKSPAHPRARLPIQVLARLLFLLDDDSDELRKRLIGTGFSTHESKYRSGQETLPRWVFATEKDNSSHSLDRFLVDLRRIESTSAEHNKQQAEKFRSDFRAALKEHVPNQAESDPRAPEAEPTDAARSDAARPERPAEDPTTPAEPECASAVPMDAAPPERPAEDPTIPVVPASASAADRPTGAGPWRVPDSAAAGRPFADSARPTSRQYPGTEFAGLSDYDLLCRIPIIELHQFDSMIQQLRERAARYQQELRQGNPADMVQSRNWLIKNEFYARTINEFINRSSWEQAEELYRAICWFAVSDQRPGEVDPEVIDELIGGLASNYVYRSPEDHDVYSPLTSAVIKSIWLPRGDPPRIVIPHDFVGRVRYVLGYERANYLGMDMEPAPKVDDGAQQPDTEAGPFLSTRKQFAILAALLVLIAIVAACIGTLP
jgi:hypothetical protein